jgi:hypothetical protein
VSEGQPAAKSEDSRRKYEISAPAEHETLSFSKPAPSELKLKTPTELAAHFAGKGVVDKRAIWIVHGMGQQVPFETLDALAEGVLSAATPGYPQGIQNHKPPRVTAVKFWAEDNPSDIQVVQRVEIDLPRHEGFPTEMELHLYEAYWAPLTEGVPKLADVVSFLFSGGLRGIWNCFKPFRRAMFPDDTSPVLGPDVPEGKCEQGFWNFQIPIRGAAEIILVLLMLLSLGAINAVILAASAAHLKFSFFSAWPIDEHWDQLTAIASGVSALVLTFGAMLFLAEMSKPGGLPRVLKSIISIFSWIGLIITTLAILIAAACMLLITRVSFIADRFDVIPYRATQFVATSVILAAVFLSLAAAWRRAALRSRGISYRDDGLLLFLFFVSFLLHVALLVLLVGVEYHRYLNPRELPENLQRVIDVLASPLWVWPALLAISKFVRDLMVEYPGDVAVYITPNQIDRFDEVRKEIKKLALDSLTPLYSARAADASLPLYSKVGLVGHSLGSVIAYDTLNKLLTLDELLNNQFDVAGRTRVLETFGSPLDKIAFFFNIQGKNTYHVREQLAASVQPLIQSYQRFRRFPWINVYSRSDILCGRLRFYDVINPGAAVPPGVENVKDPDAVVPLVAHVEYWKNRIVWDRLYREITT